MKKTLLHGCIIMLLCIPAHLIAQVGDPSDLWLNPVTDDFATIRQNVENYYANRDKGRGSGYVQWKRWEYFNERRLLPDGKITNTAARNFEEYNRYMEQLQNSDQPLTTNGYWESLGITNYVNGAGWNPGVGRVNVIAFHPSSTSTFWVGTPAGGLWKTTNGGTNWTSLTDGMPRIGVSGIAVNYNNTNIIYILTGDGDAGDTKSVGVLKTTNGGTTWLSTGLSWSALSNVRGYKLAMHPSNSAILFAVTSSGIYKTVNSGADWTKVLNIYGYDLEFKPGDPTVMYVCGGSTFYRSTDTGDSWTQITSGVPTTAWRMAIGVSPANSSYVYLMTGPATAVGYFKGFYRSYDSGLNFYLKADQPNLLGYPSNGLDNKHQTTYDLAIAVSHDYVSDVIIGGINTWKNLNYGLEGDWTITSMWNDPSGVIGYTHADIHDLAINPLNKWLYCCSDGGIFRSTDFGDNWTDLTSGLSHTQWYRIAGTEANSNLLIGGTQDNGSNKWTGGSTILHILGADGMDAMIDPTDANKMYYESQGGGLKRSLNGGTSYTNIAPAWVVGPWITPLVMNMSTPATIYVGWDTIRKSTNSGTSWSLIGTNIVSGNGAMAIGKNNTSRLYASGGSNIWMSNDAGSSWTNVKNGLPNLTITFIAVDPTYSLDVYITYGGYTSGQKVYYSSNAGTSWTNISGSLPNLAVNCIAFEDNSASSGPYGAVYIGNDIGVFYRDNTIGDWIPFRNGLPTVPVFDLEINLTAGVIRAATFGRGLWSSALYSGCPTAYSLTVSNDPSNPYFTGFQYYEASSYTTSSRIITGGLGTDVTYKAGDYIRLTTGFHVLQDNLFKAILGPCDAAKKGPVIIPVTGTYQGPMKD